MVEVAIFVWGMVAGVWISIIVILYLKHIGHGVFGRDPLRKKP